MTTTEKHKRNTDDKPPVAIFQMEVEEGKPAVDLDPIEVPHEEGEEKVKNSQDIQKSNNISSISKANPQQMNKSKEMLDQEYFGRSLPKQIMVLKKQKDTEAGAYYEGTDEIYQPFSYIEHYQEVKKRMQKK